ncbi:MAG: GNAT family N-acetyltransferase [Clostridia bacterium]|nr:GNAT family N-acetyltransferase [Clostridia bacterium]
MNAEIDISNVELKTPRLLLRPWRESDLNDFFAYARVDGVGQMAGWNPHKSIEESRGILDSFIEHKKTFALEYNGRAVGSLGIEKYSEDRFPELAEKRCRELGFVLAKDCWGQGLMPEAVKEVCRYLFEDVRLDAILCAHFLRNERSARVQQKCGFVFYAAGTFLTHYGTLEDDRTNILTKERWSELQKGNDQDFSTAANKR